MKRFVQVGDRRPEALVDERANECERRFGARREPGHAGAVEDEHVSRPAEASLANSSRDGVRVRALTASGSPTSAASSSRYVVVSVAINIGVREELDRPTCSIPSIGDAHVCVRLESGGAARAGDGNRTRVISLEG
jgi:hypothetical protein